MTVHETMTSPWRKSSYSGGHGGNCLEVRWRKSSYSERGLDNCLEARLASGATVDMRDSQHPHLGHLSFAPAEWRAFLAEVSADRR
jgi:hypothetical protein